MHSAELLGLTRAHVLASREVTGLLVHALSCRTLGLSVAWHLGAARACTQLWGLGNTSSRVAKVVLPVQTSGHARYLAALSIGPPYGLHSICHACWALLLEASQDARLGGRARAAGGAACLCLSVSARVCVPLSS